MPEPTWPHQEQLDNGRYIMEVAIPALRKAEASLETAIDDMVAFDDAVADNEWVGRVTDGSIRSLENQTTRVLSRAGQRLAKQLQTATYNVRNPSDKAAHILDGSNIVGTHGLEDYEVDLLKFLDADGNREWLASHAVKLDLRKKK